MGNKQILLVLLVLFFVISHSGCLEDTYETRHINERFEVKSFEDFWIYGDRYFAVDYIDKNNKVKSINDYYSYDYNNHYREEYVHISFIDSDVSYLVYNKVVIKYQADIYIVKPTVYIHHYYTLYWGDDMKMRGADSEYKEGKWPTQQVSVTHY